MMENGKSIVRLAAKALDKLEAADG